MKLSKGSVVKIKSLSWYNKNKDSYGEVGVPFIFINEMSEYCGKKTTIKKICYDETYKCERIKINVDKGKFTWSPQMFEKNNNCFDLE